MAILPGLSSIGDALFGSSPEVNTQTLPTMSPEQLKALNDLIAMLTGGENPLTQGYGGQLTAEQNAAQRASLTALEQAALKAASGEGYTKQAATSLQDILKERPEDLTQYYQQAIAAPMEAEFTGSILPELTRRFAGQSGFSSDRIAAEGKAAEGLTREMNRALSEAVLSGQRDLKGRQLSAAGALAGIPGMELQNILGIQAGGAAAREQEQIPLTAQYAEFQRRLAGQQMSIEDILRALGLQTKENIVSVTPGSSGILPSFLGGVGQGAGQALGKGMIG